CGSAVWRRSPASAKASCSCLKTPPAAAISPRRRERRSRPKASRCRPAAAGKQIRCVKSSLVRARVVVAADLPARPRRDRSRWPAAGTSLMDAAGSKEKYLAALPWAIDITDAMLDAFEAADALRKWSSPRSVSDKAKAGYEAFLVATKHFQW